MRLIIIFIAEEGVEEAERELLRMSAPLQNLYNPARLVILRRLLLTDDGNTGIFRAFTFNNSLRFTVLCRAEPSPEMLGWLADEIKRTIKANKMKTVMLWYSQVDGFTRALFDQLGGCADPHHFFLLRMQRDAIDTNVDLKGLTAQRCGPEEINDCIDILEDAFTPFPDAPGSFRGDREGIASAFLDERGGAALFCEDGNPVGLYAHLEGHISQLAVCGKYQGKGYGEAILRAALKAIRERGSDAELTVDASNERALALYRKVGLQTVYESTLVTLPKKKSLFSNRKGGKTPCKKN